jgi:tRNA A-37 threonylcarbamoyl transferase component Bud32/FixJ family two-component response regulator
MSKVLASAPRREPNVASAANRGSRLCLIVHDDLDIRLRLAALVRKATPRLDADSVTRTAFDALTAERIGTYVAVMLIIEFMLSDHAEDPLARLTRLRDRAPRLPVFVFARGGDERSAARAMKMGAADYWPIHSVNVGELADVLQPLLEPAPGAARSNTADFDRRTQPQIAGYRLLKKIADSVAATVYLARNDELPQPVALKVQALKGRQVVTEADRQRFSRECEILSALNHRSIANVLDFGITEDYLYLALEYFPCGSLRDRLRNPVSEADALNYARQIGEALQVVHSAHIVHRDLKPSNLMLTDDNRIVLIDFGSARTQLVRSDLSRSDLCTGTPYYVCPEQIEDRDPDGRGDLYSLGVVLFEMLAGALPYVGNNLSEILTGHRLAAIPRLPQPLLRYQPIIDRLMAKQPSERYPTAAMFLDHLAALSAPARPAAHTAIHVGALDP